MLEPHIQEQINIAWKHLQEMKKNKKDKNSADDKKEKVFSNSTRQMMQFKQTKLFKRKIKG